MYKYGFYLKWYLKTVDIIRDVEGWLQGMTEGREETKEIFYLISNTDQIILPKYFHIS